MASAMSNPKQTCSMHGGQKNSMNQKNLLKIKIEKYLKVPLLLAVFWLIAAGIMFIVSREAGLIMLVFDLIYMVIVLVIYYQKRPDIMAEMVNFSFEQSQIQKELLKDLALPYTLIDLDGRFLWSNQQFYDVIGKEKMHKKSLFQVFPELTKEILPIQTGEASVAILYEERNYRLEMKCVHAKWGDEDDFIDASNSLIAVYLFDETEIKKYIRENQEQKMAACLIYIDNYEEALESIDEVKESLLTALINRKLTKYMQNAGAIIKRLEKDKYFAVFQKKNLEQLQNDKFSILDEIRAINVGNSIAVTLSISVGSGMDGYLETYEAARSGMDLALGRGGDQAVVKDGEKVLYYGGKTQGVEKGTRVKARVKARALKELLEGKDRVVIMGHKIPDMDAIGSAIGIYRIAKNLNKKAHIVMDVPPQAIRSVVNNFVGNSNYEEDMFIKSEEAMELMDDAEDMVTFCRDVLEHMELVLAETPEMLPVLKQAGVVDSGGQGLMQVLKGALEGVLGKGIPFDAVVAQTSQKAAPVGAARDDIDTADIKFGYCTEFIINVEDAYDDDEEYEDEDSEYYEIVCPSCGEVVCFDDTLEEDELICPACGELVTGIEVCDGDCSNCTADCDG